MSIFAILGLSALKHEASEKYKPRIYCVNEGKYEVHTFSGYSDCWGCHSTFPSRDEAAAFAKSYHRTQLEQTNKIRVD